MSRTPDFILGDEFAKVLTETTMSLVCVLDQDARILFFNDACERVTGFTRDEVIGGDARDFVIPPEEAEAFSEVIDYIWSTGLSGLLLDQPGPRHARGEPNCHSRSWGISINGQVVDLGA